MEVSFQGHVALVKLSIIVPTYNEVESLPYLVERLHACLADCDYELIIVDDNSPDGTGALAEELARERPIRVIHREGKLGLATAVVEGFRHASGEVLCVIDADLQHPPEKIPELLEAMGDTDIVIASRYVKGGGTEGWTFVREMISRSAKLIPRFLFARIRPVRDPLSGFFLFRKKVIEGVPLDPVGYKILLEILVRGRHNGVTEVPYVFVGRERGKSTFNRTEQINYLKHLWRLVRAEKEAERFLKFCLVGGIGVGVNLGAYWLFTRAIGVPDVPAFLLSTQVSILNNFVWNDLWTFRDRRGSTAILPSAVRGAKFHLIGWTAATPSILSFWGLIEFTGIFDIIAATVSIVISTLFRFVLNKWWTWQ